MQYRKIGSYRVLAILMIVLISCSEKENVTHGFVHQESLDSFNNLPFSENLSVTDVIILGETHYSSQIGLFTSKLLPFAKESGFSVFALEIGPYSAIIFQDLLDTISKADDPYEAYRTYFEPLRKITQSYHPVPFFSGREDLEFILKARELGFNIKGFDQEFYSSAPFVLRGIKERAKPDSLLNIIYQNAQESLRYHFTKDEEERNYPVYTSLINDSTISQFVLHASNSFPEATEWYRGLTDSWEIYNANRGGKYAHQKRVAYMRSHIQRIQSEHPEEKIIIKVGRLHAGKHRQRDAYDIGHFLAQQDINSVHVGFYRGFYDNRDYTSGADSFHLLSYANETQWTAIDISYYKTRLNNGKEKFPDGLQEQLTLNVIDNFDYMIIPPKDQKQSSLFVD